MCIRDRYGGCHVPANVRMGCVASNADTPCTRKNKRKKHRGQKGERRRSAPSLHLQRSKSQAGEVPPRKWNELADAKLLEQFSDMELLGSGCFATVVKAKKRGGDAEMVSVKMIDKRLIDNAAEVTNEITALRDVSQHDAILTLQETLEAPEAHFLVTELLVGGDLFDRLYASPHDGKFSMEYAAEHMDRMFDALAHIHKHEWVHRDIKPENLIYATQDSHRCDLRIIDFGFAATLRQGSSISDGTLLGTPHYLAPEMAGGKAYDHLVDVWAVGIVLHQMVFGFLPFDDENLDDEFADAETLWENNKDLLKKISEAKFDFDGTHWVGVPSKFKHFFQKVLCPDPRARYTAAQALEHEWLKKD
eukprot:TRINITY_DN44271_c0_g1_i1.p1 TRINITY_DN44271_c0_g1~~TRINITY_DN44271_c0_g1_i1.p1  ORF type:complete len:362 (-),score=108.64 TRINITY_DN44271_c0_g1_i1:175-1260(-)